jgi:hypothetical protein
MTTPPYRQAWQQAYAKDQASYAEILTWDPFRSWERNSIPESTAARYFSSGLNILCGGGGPEQGRRFLQHCQQIAERALAEGKVESPLCKDRFPLNRGQLLRVSTYARALLGGPLDEGALRQAAADFEQWSQRFPKHKWSDYQEAHYLAGVRLALLGNDRERVARLCSRRRALRWHGEEYALLKDLAGGPQPPPPQGESPLLARFDVYFDSVRDPNYISEGYQEVEALRVELAALRDRWFDSPDGRIDFNRVIDSISI